jgi:hypothetical protein
MCFELALAFNLLSLASQTWFVGAVFDLESVTAEALVRDYRLQQQTINSGTTVDIMIRVSSVIATLCTIRLHEELLHQARHNYCLLWQ